MGNRISLQGVWQIKIDPEETGLAESWAVRPLTGTVALTVPGCVQQLDCFAEEFPPQNDMRNSYCGTYFMEKTVFIPDFSENHRCNLVFGGVIPCCHLWINGRYVSKICSSVCAAEVDISGLAEKNTENRITVAIVEQHIGLSTGMRFAGLNWSGIYSNSYLEIGSNLRFKDVYVSTAGGDEVVVKGCLVNSGSVTWHGEVKVCLGSKTASGTYAVQAGSEAELAIELDSAGLLRWSSKAPNLHELTLSLIDEYGISEEYTCKTGLRNITLTEKNICFDGKPQYFAGAGQEYYSPTIAPLTEDSIIRRRYQALLDHGFRFFRHHTHVPTEEELTIADEMGIMLCAEFGLVSNFNKTTPFEEGLALLEIFVRQTRRHPSLLVYCLGNEGSQLMVDSYIERNRAKAGYEIIKSNTTEQLAIISFGVQGELPELPNDFETPHLWSDNFIWGYDGLTDIPWDMLGSIQNEKPCIIHEYGKFGVWPDAKEEDTYPPMGSNPDFGEQALLALADLGLQDRQERFVKASRRLSGICNRIILEEARRQSYVCGYTLWVFFRRCYSNAGLCNDMGTMYDQDPRLFQNGCNADAALLIDRGFKNRGIAYGIPETICFTVSNYGEDDITDAALCWEFTEDGKIIIGGITEGIHRPLGTTNTVCDITFTLPPAEAHAKLELRAVLKKADKIISQNSWDFWAFNTRPDINLYAFLHMESVADKRLVEKALPKAVTLSSAHSVVTGCRSWRNPIIADTAIGNIKTVLIADRYDETVRKCYENGVKVLLIDTGKLPEEWMVPPVSDTLGGRDTSRFFSSFRAGWDKGNLLTIIEDSPLISLFPQEGFCDLQYYDMIQGARSLCPKALECEFGVNPERIIEGIAKIPVTGEAESIVQDPNAVKEQSVKKQRSFAAREQGYLLQIKNGENKITVCTLKLTDNIAGTALLKSIVKGLNHEVKYAL